MKKIIEHHNTSLNIALSLIRAYPWEGVCDGIQCWIIWKVCMGETL